MSPRPIPVILVLAALVGCSSPTSPVASSRGHPGASFAITSSAVASGSGENVAQATDPGCSFDRGTTTCVTTEQYTETSSHVESSGCLAGPPPNFRPGHRSRTFSDTWLVTVTTTTLYRGRSEHEYDTSTSTSRQLIGSTLVSDVCEAI
jgi:hypothetical protein